VDGAVRASSDFLLDDILVDPVMYTTVLVVFGVFGASIERFLASLSEFW
jgi:hypothetical protein